METEATRNAASLAIELHKNQLDKAGRPYAQHPIRVARRLIAMWDDATEDEVVAALLHDTIEDCGASEDSLMTAGISRRATAIVRRLSRPQGLPYLDWIRAIANSGDEGAIRVKLADLADNLDPDRPSFPGRDRMIGEKYLPALAILAQANSEHDVLISDLLARRGAAP